MTNDSRLRTSVEIIPAIMPKTVDEITAKTEALSSVASVYQLDIMDGTFVATQTWPYMSPDQWQQLLEPKTAEILKSHRFEAHLMVVDPLEIGTLLVKAGVERLLVHIECFKDTKSARSAVASWKDAGAKEVGFAILVETPLSALDLVLDVADSVQIMSIAKVGYQGQPFDDRALLSLSVLHTSHPSLILEGDGGVSLANAAQLVALGATRLTVGSAFMHGDPIETFKAFKEKVSHAV